MIDSDRDAPVRAAAGKAVTGLHWLLLPLFIIGAVVGAVLGFVLYPVVSGFREAFAAAEEFWS